MEKFIICGLIGSAYLAAIIIGIMTLNAVEVVEPPSYNLQHYSVNPDLR